ncbi:hypothetical protein PDIG_04200 [Penicillium digitatum PHI26]|uniref:Uncharacterized protein n=2 Tax=Penicillium digitatum TaxID=36651 RepID=K9GBE9_PEND2|nr:hypothetical protein PDIP_08870 [Penicillium digitatum Pd1]EKV19260.1 hypothetical protein PDIG_04200 [Penicillium digitatum PHI26]EKV21220.1 hypothetical protein PDIP_08870 [Penicillium digitatum Pd1]
MSSRPVNQLEQFQHHGCYHRESKPGWAFHGAGYVKLFNSSRGPCKPKLQRHGHQSNQPPG